MRIIRYPCRESWSELLQRPPGDLKDETVVRSIVESVRHDGDRAVRGFSALFDRIDLPDFRVTGREFEEAERQMPDGLKFAIWTAKRNIEIFHSSQFEGPKKIETTKGVVCWRKSVPIEKVGLYAPAGTAPLFSTVLMLGVPAKLAGCEEIVLCSPPNAEGKVAPPILFAARLCGIDRVFKIGGAQAIAAMAYGTETIPRVYKIFGPGNRYVTAAKRVVSNDVVIDIPAGPSEVTVVADTSCNPAFVAADLLSQAEHGTDSQVLFVTSHEELISQVVDQVEKQLVALPRREIAERALEHSKAILMHDLDESVALVNEYAPEHLILAIEDAEQVADSVTNAGSVFIGNYSCESAGDYASGTNHTLPTNGSARALSGVALDSFMKKITFQKLTEEGLRNLGPTIECMAAAEGLEAHRRAVSIRLESLDGI